MWQNVNNEVFLAWFKFQANIPSLSGVCVQGEWQKYKPPSLPLSQDEGLKNIGHSMSIRNLIFGVNSVTVSYWFVMTVYYKIRQLFYYKVRQKFIRKCVRIFITKSDGFVTKCDSYYKMQRFYYKMRHLLQYATLRKYTPSYFSCR